MTLLVNVLHGDCDLRMDHNECVWSYKEHKRFGFRFRLSPDERGARIGSNTECSQVPLPAAETEKRHGFRERIGWLLER